jgi:hypothetical protein
MKLNVNTYSEKSVTIGFKSTLVSFFGLVNITVSGVEAKFRYDAYILRLFSYL